MAIPAEHFEVYAEFGLAAEKGQLLEVDAGNFAFSNLTLFLDPSTLSDEVKAVFRGVIDDLNSKTFGTLIKYIKRSVTLDDSITKTIDEALARRNYLTHHFFRAHNFALFSEAGRRAMIDELHEIQGTLDSARATLQAMAELSDKLAGKKILLSEELAAQFQASGQKLDI